MNAGPAAARTHLRIARPTRDLHAAEQFWVGGLGLSVLYRTEPGADDRLLMVGWPEAAWHLELVLDPSVEPAPTDEDLLVLYLCEEIPADLVARLVDHGGTRVIARNPYWDRWGTTISDPDGYRLVLSSRSWNSERAHPRGIAPES